MQNYPSNSNKAAKENVEAGSETKKIESVVSGEVHRRKTPLGQRLAETFVGGDVKSVAGYVVFEVLVPAAKDMVADAFSQGIERMIYGEVRSTSRRTGLRPGGPNGYTAYNRITQGASKARSGLDEFSKREQPSRRERTNHEFDGIVIATRAEADTVLRRLYDILEQYETATVSDLYELVGITPAYTDGKWGWTSLPGAGISRIREGYLLDLPKPEPVD